MARYVGPHERRARIEDALVEWYRSQELANRAAAAPYSPGNQELYEACAKRHVDADVRLRRLARDAIMERRRAAMKGGYWRATASAEEAAVTEATASENA